jgi:hypothetical protein
MQKATSLALHLIHNTTTFLQWLHIQCYTHPQPLQKPTVTLLSPELGVDLKWELCTSKRFYKNLGAFITLAWHSVPTAFCAHAIERRDSKCQPAD